MMDNRAINQALADIAKWEDLPPELQEFAFDQLNTLLHQQDCFVLVDPYLGEPELVQDQLGSEAEDADLQTLDALRSKAWGLDCYSVDPGPLRQQMAQAPYLIHLKAADKERYAQSLYLTLDMAQRERWKAIVQGQGSQHVGGWITVHDPADGKALASSLGALMLVGRLDLGSTYLRLADTRLLELLHHIDSVPLSPELPPALQWTKQLQGIRQWAYPDHAFGVMSIKGSEGATQEANLALLAKHWQVLEHAEAINRTLMKWQQSHAKPGGKPFAQVWSAVQAAQQLGHPDPISQAQFAAEQLQKHLI